MVARHRPRPKKTAGGGLILPANAIYVPPNRKRHATAKKWAERRTREELIEAVALLFQRRAEDRVELLGRYLWSLPDAVNKRAAQRNAKAKQDKNPEAIAIKGAKAAARKLFLERRSGNLPRLATVEQFAIEACRRWGELKSIGVVVKWAALWEKEELARPKVAEIWAEHLAKAREVSNTAWPSPQLVATATLRKWPSLNYAAAERVAREMWATVRRS